MSDPTVIYAQLAVEGATAELYLNGIPVSRVGPRPQVPIENAAVEELLVPGRNELCLVVEPGSHPSVARTEQRQLDFRPLEVVGRLLRFRDGVPATVEHGELLGEVRVDWQDGKPARRTFPVEASTGIELGSAHGRWAWQDAPQLTLDEALIDEACAVLDEVATAIRTKHLGLLWQLNELQLVDVQRAYPAITEAYLRAEIAEGLTDYEGIDDPVLPRDRSRHDFRLVGGGRLLELLDDDWSTSFKLGHQRDGSPVPYRIMLCRIDGALRIMR